MNALVFASVASMVDLFNRDNIEILDELGYDVTIACNFTEGSVYLKSQAIAFGKELRKKGYNVIHVPVPRSIKDIKGMINSIRILRNDMARKKYKIIHCQSPIGGVLCRIAAMSFRKMGTKVLYYAHGFHFFTGADTIYWLLYYNVEKLCARFTDCLLTLNREDYLRASKHFKTRVEYVPGIGLDIAEIKDTVADKVRKCDEIGIPSDKKIILSVCELSERKNCEVALKAFIKADRNDAILVFCGIGAQMDMLKDMVYEAGVEDKVFFLGFRNDIIEMFKIADVFIFTSKQEGLPVALMQAMACELPVLCSRIRGNVDLIRNKQGGYMFNYDDVNGFARGINALLDNSELCEKMGKKNADNVMNYDKSVVNNIIRRIYISLGDE